MYTILPLLIAFVNWVSVTQVPLHAHFATADNQGNFYVIDDHNALLKFDSLGNVLRRYHHDSGKLKSIDATNPLKPLCYFSTSALVVSLDNTLTPASMIELQKYNYTQVTSVCRSSDEKIWLYDGADYTIKKLDYAGKVFTQGTDLMQQTGFAPEVTFMIEQNQKVYVCDSTRGILVMDLYGNYEKTILLKGLQQFQFLYNQILYFDNHLMLLYNLQTLATDTISLAGVESFHQAAYSQNRLMTLDENRLSLYRHEKP